MQQLTFLTWFRGKDTAFLLVYCSICTPNHSIINISVTVVIIWRYHWYPFHLIIWEKIWLIRIWGIVCKVKTILMSRTVRLSTSNNFITSMMPVNWNCRCSCWLLLEADGVINCFCWVLGSWWSTKRLSSWVSSSLPLTIFTVLRELCLTKPKRCLRILWKAK